MATVTLNYDARNKNALTTLNYILAMGLFNIAQSPIVDNLTPFEKSLQDVKNGRVKRIKNVNNAINEILQ
ncbi:MAG: hypothetical protein LBS50_03660 [Prevotellaceae bacterium]|jgi:hypothetical protein|nr:hypothetical protein [Prevotellaceae bacterium]